MIHSFALVLLLGFELSFYLLIVQTGIAEHYHSDLIKLSPLFIGGVLGTIASGYRWGKITNPIHKIIIALSLQLTFSFLYPDYNTLTLGLLGISVGMMAPLSIYLFKEHQRYELLLALSIAYTIGTYAFTSLADHREWMALVFSLISLISAILLRDYEVDQTEHKASRSITAYLPLMLWILLDSNLFETLSRHEGINIWSEQTYIIISFHLLGLVTASFIKLSEVRQHLIIALLFIGSYTLSYLGWKLSLAVLYPFTISYYNVIVFTTLSKEINLLKLSYLMVLIAWIASGLGLALALSKILH
ncbi:hypothetical protein ACFLR3_00660 [Campylobacterota bacterium]